MMVIQFIWLYLFDTQPISFKKAVESNVWRKAIKEKIDAIKHNQTWELVEFPSNKRPSNVKQVFKVKYLNDESIEKYKARLAARGFLEQVGLDYS